MNAIIACSHVNANYDIRCHNRNKNSSLYDLSTLIDYQWSYIDMNCHQMFYELVEKCAMKCPTMSVFIRSYHHSNRDFDL